MRSDTFIYAKTTVSIASASSRVNLEALRQIPQIKLLADSGLNPEDGHYFCSNGAKIYHSVVLTVMRNSDTRELEVYAVARDGAGPTVFYRVTDAAGVVMFTEIDTTPSDGYGVHSVHAMVAIRNNQFVGDVLINQTDSPDATLVEEEELPADEDNNVPTWIPSANMLVRIKEGYAGCKEVYILRDVDVYEQAFILVNADSARRQRDEQYRTVGSLRVSRRDEELLDEHGPSAIKVPFDQVEPFQLEL